MRKDFVAGLLLILVLTAGCAWSEGVTPPKAEAPSAAEHGETVQNAVEHVTKVVQVTEDNDPNDLIGRPNGYTDAVVLYDDRLGCGELMGAWCGATIEVWPSEDDAEARSDYIQRTQKENPSMGVEYNTVNGTALLRVAGELKPSEAKVYAGAFTS